MRKSEDSMQGEGDSPGIDWRHLRFTGTSGASGFRCHEHLEVLDEINKQTNQVLPNLS